MIPRGTVLFCSLGLSALPLGACDHYDRMDGNYLLSAVDPAKFPAAYLGKGGMGNKPGMGVFSPATGFASGQPIFYYSFPLSSGQSGAADPLDVSQIFGNGPANTYVFDPAPPTAGGPLPKQSKCVAPQGYKYNAQQDAVPLDRQGSIFTQLPDDSSYVPVVAEVPVVSNGEACQDYKSEDAVLTGSDVQVPEIPPDPNVPMDKPKGKPDGKYLAWAIIDPAAMVLGPDGSNGQGNTCTSTKVDPADCGIGIQQWGFYNHYLLAYLDGGYIDTQVDMVMGKPVTHLKTQNLYFPTMVMGMDMMGNPAVVPNMAGGGFDIVDAARSATGYSPLCHVMSYSNTDPKAAPITFKNVADLMAAATGMNPTVSITDTGNLIYCLQVQ